MAYKLWFRGSSTLFATTGATATVPTGVADAAPGTIKAPASPEWLLVDVMGANPTLLNEGEAYTTPSLNEYSDSIPRWRFSIRTKRFYFPADWPDLQALLQHLSRKYFYFAVHTYDVDLHPADTCVAVTAKVTQEDTYDDGSKRLTIELRKRGITEKLDA